MTPSSKDKLHKILNALIYIILAINIILPLVLLALSTVALVDSGSVFATQWALRLTATLALVEVISQIRKAVKKKIKR